MNKILLYLIVLIGLANVCLAQLPQTIDGSQRNKIIDSGGLGGGGGGTLGAAVTNSVNVWTAPQNYTSPTNLFLNSTNIIYTAPLLFNTNRAYLAGVQIETHAANGNPIWILSDDGVPASDTSFYFGDVSGPNGSGLIRHDTASKTIYMTGDANTLHTDLQAANGQSSGILVGAGYQVQATATGTTITRISTDTLTIPATSWTAANGLSINGFFNIGSASSQTTTNNGIGGFYSQGSISTLNMLSTSNLVVTTTDGTSSISSGTNQLFTVNVNGGASPQATSATFQTRTNSFNSLNTINIVHTNLANRLYVNIGVTLPSTVGAGSSAALWTVNAIGVTQYMGRCSAEAGVSGNRNGHVAGIIDPYMKYMVTNLDVSGGTPSLTVGEWNQSQF